MACMEHVCQDCGWYCMDNKSYKRCLECDSIHVNNWWDEANDEQKEVI